MQTETESNKDYYKIFQPFNSYFNFKKCFIDAMIICAQTHICLCFWRSQEYSLVVLERTEKRTHKTNLLLFINEIAGVILCSDYPNTRFRFEFKSTPIQFIKYMLNIVELKKSAFLVEENG